MIFECETQRVDPVFQKVSCLYTRKHIFSHTNKKFLKIPSVLI